MIHITTDKKKLKLSHITKAKNLEHDHHHKQKKNYSKLQQTNAVYKFTYLFEEFLTIIIQTAHSLVTLPRHFHFD